MKEIQNAGVFINHERVEGSTLVRFMTHEIPLAASVTSHDVLIEITLDKEKDVEKVNFSNS